MIQQFRLGISNVFLIKDGQRSVLVDTGRPSEAQRVASLLLQAGVALADLSLIVHTHGHWDHAGSTRQLKRWTPAPAAIHGGDADLVRQGTNGVLIPTSWQVRLLKPILDLPYPSWVPDVFLYDGMDLAHYGVQGRILSTPGHTAGSISVLSGGEAIVGDLMMGGYLAGRLFPRLPTYHYFAENMAILRSSIKKLLTLDPCKIYVSHGGPLSPSDVIRRFGKDIGY